MGLFLHYSLITLGLTRFLLNKKNTRFLIPHKSSCLTLEKLSDTHYFSTKNHQTHMQKKQLILSDDNSWRRKNLEKVGIDLIVIWHWLLFVRFGLFWMCSFTFYLQEVSEKDFFLLWLVQVFVCKFGSNQSVSC